MLYSFQINDEEHGSGRELEYHRHCRADEPPQSSLTAAVDPGSEPCSAVAQTSSAFDSGLLAAEQTDRECVIGSRLMEAPGINLERSTLTASCNMNLRISAYESFLDALTAMGLSACVKAAVVDHDRSIMVNLYVASCSSIHFPHILDANVTPLHGTRSVSSTEPRDGQ